MGEKALNRRYPSGLDSDEAFFSDCKCDRGFELNLYGTNQGKHSNHLQRDFSPEFLISLPTHAGPR